jgi:hypothetical protein
LQKSSVVPPPFKADVIQDFDQKVLRGNKHMSSGRIVQIIGAVIDVEFPA